MSKKVLVIGGTYFAGRVFAMLAAREAGFELTFVNRGRYSMSMLPNVKEYACDRHDPDGLRALPAEEYDAIVDFCAYTPEEVRTLLTNLPGKYGKYILLSTADVYDRSYVGAKNEESVVMTAQPAGPAGEYMFNKALCEAAACILCEEKGIALTVLRPSFIYGPYNYAPRESWFIQKIVAGESIPVPIDSEAKFQFVYVKDVANAIIACVNSDVCAGKAYNLAAPEVLDYAAFMETLKNVSDLPVNTYGVTVEQVIQQQLPLPFPLLPEENELFDGSRICRELGLQYTPFADGMIKAYQGFKSVYTNR